MVMSRRSSARSVVSSVAVALLLGVSALSLAAKPASAQDKLRFAVGPFQPTPTDTRKAYEPFFKHLADKLGRPAPVNRRIIELVHAAEDGAAPWAGPALRAELRRGGLVFETPFICVMELRQMIFAERRCRLVDACDEM